MWKRYENDSALAALGLIVLCLGLGLTLATHSEAQEEPPRFDDEVDVIEIFLDISVTDKRGNQILGLNEADFEIDLAGKPAAITSVTFVSSQAPEDLRQEAAERGFDLPEETEETDRLFVLFFHDLMASNFATLGVGTQRSVATGMARRWVSQELGERDYVAVVSFDYKLKVQQDFTQNSELLDRALRRTMLRRDPERSERPVDHDATQDTPSLLRHLPSGKVLRNRTPFLENGLVVLAEALGPLDGRKNLVFFGIGVGINRGLARWLNLLEHRPLRPRHHSPAGVGPHRRDRAQRARSRQRGASLRLGPQLPRVVALDLEAHHRLLPAHGGRHLRHAAEPQGRRNTQR